jgi:hypothetical protein
VGPERPRPPLRELVGPMDRSACRQEVAAAEQARPTGPAARCLVPS